MSELPPPRWHRWLRLVPVLATVLVLAEWGLAWHFATAHPGEDAYAYLIEGMVAAPVLLAITWVLVSRRPDLSITWVFAAILLFGAVQGAAGTWGHEAVLGHADLPGGVVALTASGVAQGLGVTTTLLLLNLFPTGAPVSRRWRVVIWLVGGAMVLVLVPPLLGPSPFGEAEHLSSLAGIPGLLHGVAPAALWPVLEAVTRVEAVLLVLATLLHLLVRYRRARGVERLQLRLFTWSVVAGIAVIVVPWYVLVEAAFHVVVPDWLAWSVGPLVVWTGIAMAVVRHRLYDIDRLVSRTVSWTVATVLLLGLYLGVVVVLQSGLRPVLGEGEVPVALATLAAATTARPLLARVRGVVDRRFDRAGYDAARTVEAFGRGLRDEVGLDAVVAGLRATAASTVQPDAVGVLLVERRP